MPGGPLYVILDTFDRIPRTEMQTPTGDAFGARRRALEDAFFQERDQQLVEKLRQELKMSEVTKPLSLVSGITDEKVLANLVKSGVKPETLAALGIIPMVQVAWADGTVSNEERDAVLRAAAENGVEKGSASYELLNQWLQAEPDSKMLTAWTEYFSALAKSMPLESLAVLRERIITRCRDVAKAAGGFLGLTGKISKAEQDAIEELERAMAR